jgi:hypothetical protein
METTHYTDAADRQGLAADGALARRVNVFSIIRRPTLFIRIIRGKSSG